MMAHHCLLVALWLFRGFGHIIIRFCSSSPVENQNDLELDFKVFFSVDSGCCGIELDESN